MNHNAIVGLIAVAVSYWTGFGGSFAGSLSWRHQLVWHLGSFAASVAGGWLLWRRESSVRLRCTHPFVDVCVGLVVIETALRALFGQGWEASSALAEAFSLVALFYLLLQVGGDGRELAAGWLIAISVWCLLGAWLAYQGRYRELAMPLGNRTLMAGLLVLVTPLTAGLWTRPRAAVVALASVILVAAIIKTRSASAMVILVLMGLGFSVWTLVQRQLAVRWWPPVIALLLIAAGAALTSSYEPLGRLRAVILAREDPSLSWDNRQRYWAGAIPAVLEHPMFGQGPGSVGVLYPKFRLQKPGFAPHGEIVPDLHSLPAHWLFQYGLVGLGVRTAAYVAFLLWVFAQGGRLERSAGWALAAYGVFSLAHYQLATPGILLAAVCVAVIAAPRIRCLELSARYARVLGGGLILASLAVVLFQSRGICANYLAERAVREPAGLASASLARAALLDPRGGFYDFLAALRIEERLAKEPAGSPKRQFLIETCERHYSAALADHPWLMPVLASRAGFRLRWERACDAIEPLETAVSLDFYSSLSHFDLADAYRGCGRPEAGAAEAAVGILAQPTLVYASLWRKEPEFLSGVLERARRWLEAWFPPSKPADAAALRQLESFLQDKISEIRAGRAVPVVSLTFSDTLGAEFQDDPFAFLFHRKAPRLETARIQLDGLNTGSWAPGGIEFFAWLPELTYTQVRTAYERKQLDALMLGVGGRQVGRP